MNNELRPPNEFNKLIGSLLESRFPQQKIERNAMNLHGACVDVSLRVQILMVMTTRNTTIQ
jgi:hypothetical protein